MKRDMKTRFKGHETFYFREGWLSKALFVMNDEPDYKLFAANNGISKLGVGANMVKSIKYWLQTTNLIKMDYKSKEYVLTSIGKDIANYDLDLEDPFTLWLLHINLVTNYKMATTWNIFFNEFHAIKFTSSNVKDALSNYLDRNGISYKEKSLNSDVDLLLNMYTKELNKSDPEENFSCPLSRLDLLRKNRENYERQLAKLDILNPYIVLYLMLLKTQNSNTSSISIRELEEGNNSLTNVLSINRVIINEYLDRLSNKKMIRVEKTAGLDMVYITTILSPESVIQKYYEERN